MTRICADLLLSHLSPTGGPGYSALVFDNQTEVTVGGITKALSYAQSGLPVVFVEKLPSTSPYSSEVAFNVSAIVEEMLQVSLGLCRRPATDFAQLPGVKLIASLAELPTLLDSINIEPDAKFAEHNSNSESRTTGERPFLTRHSLLRQALGADQWRRLLLYLQRRTQHHHAHSSDRKRQETKAMVAGYLVRIHDADRWV